MLVAILIFVPSVAFGSNYRDMIPAEVSGATLENLFGNSTTTELEYENSKIILTQSTSKTIFNIGESIVVNSNLLNTGNHNVTIFHWTPAISLELKNKNGTLVGMVGGGFVLGGNILLNETLKPAIPNPVDIMPTTLAPPNTHIAPARFVVSKPGNYTITSVALIRFDQNDTGSFKGIALWSKPLQITVLSEQHVQNETIPEFSFTIPVLLASITSLIIFHRTRN